MHSINVLTYNQLAYLLFVFIVFISSPSKCQKIKLDHVIVVVESLDIATASYGEKGFTIKSGNLHQNGLSNAHIKFQNQTSLELMTVTVDVKDNLAKEYKKLLDEKEGGVFIALTGPSNDSIELILKKLNIPFGKSKNQYWSYLTFPEESGLEHLFFIEYHLDRIDSNNVLRHTNNSSQINHVFLEGDNRVLELFNALGLAYLGKRYEDDFGKSDEYLTETGSLNVILSNHQSRPRIKAVTFGDKSGKEVSRVIF